MSQFEDVTDTGHGAKWRKKENTISGWGFFGVGWGLFSVFFKKIIDTGHKAFYNIKV